MSATYDADLGEFARRIIELQGSPTDYDKRRAVCEQSRFVLDSIEQAVMDYDGFVNEDRRGRALSLFNKATSTLSSNGDGCYAFVLDRASRAQMRLKVAAAT